MPYYQFCLCGSSLIENKTPVRSTVSDRLFEKLPCNISFHASTKGKEKALHMNFGIPLAMKVMGTSSNSKTEQAC
jgi:hypothetical protein